MNCLNSLIIEGRVTSCDTGRMKIATVRNFKNENGETLEHTCVFDVAGGCIGNYKVGTGVRIVGKLECDPTFKSVWIVPEHIETRRL